MAADFSSLPVYEVLKPSLSSFESPEFGIELHEVCTDEDNVEEHILIPYDSGYGYRSVNAKRLYEALKQYFENK